LQNRWILSCYHLCAVISSTVSDTMSPATSSTKMFSLRIDVRWCFGFLGRRISRQHRAICPARDESIMKRTSIFRIHYLYWQWNRTQLSELTSLNIDSLSSPRTCVQRFQSLQRKTGKVKLRLTAGAANHQFSRTSTVVHAPSSEGKSAFVCLAICRFWKQSKLYAAVVHNWVTSTWKGKNGPASHRKQLVQKVLAK